MLEVSSKSFIQFDIDVSFSIGREKKKTIALDWGTIDFENSEVDRPGK